MSSFKTSLQSRSVQVRFYMVFYIGSAFQHKLDSGVSFNLSVHPSACIRLLGEAAGQWTEWSLARVGWCLLVLGERLKWLREVGQTVTSSKQQ